MAVRKCVKGWLTYFEGHKEQFKLIESVNNWIWTIKRSVCAKSIQMALTIEKIKMHKVLLLLLQLKATIYVSFFRIAGLAEKMFDNSLATTDDVQVQPR